MMKINPATTSAVSIRSIDTQPSYGCPSSGRQGMPEERIAQRGLERGLLVVGRSGMPALDVLVVPNSMPGRLQRRDHFARMARMDPVVAGGRGEQHRRVMLGRRNVLVRRVFGDKRPVVR